MTEPHPNDHRICVRCTIAGHVQGVFFRATAREVALKLGIAGHARNLPDGRVEVLACGQPEAVHQLCDWLRRGPPQAQVTNVACETVELVAIAGFATG